MTTSRTALIIPAQISIPDLPAVPPTEPWAGLTEEDASRIAAALAATHAESTRKVYAFAWRRWVRWCAGRGIVPFPAEPAAVCAYLAECAEHGRSAGHHRLGLLRHRAPAPQPRRRRPGRPRRGPAGPPWAAPDHRPRPAPPGPPAERRRRAPDRRRHRPHHRPRRPRHRDPAARVRRRPAPLRARRAHPGRPRGQTRGTAAAPAPVQDRPGGPRPGRRRRPRPPRPDRPDRRPRRLARPSAAAGPARSSPACAADAPRSQPISGNAVSNLVKERAPAAGLAGDRISGHSLRAGHATSAALAGISVERIAAQTRHRRIDILIERYIRPVQALQTTSSRDLGL